MTAELGEAVVPIRATVDKLDKDLSGVREKLGKAVLSFGRGLGKAAILAPAAAITAVGVAAAGTAVELVDMAGEFQDATNAIITGTGAGGESLTAMEQTVKDLAGSAAGLNRDFGELGAVVAEVNTRTGATDETLEQFSNGILNLSRLAGGEAVENVQLVTRVMGDWDVGMDDSSRLMDQLFGASQAFGIGVDELARKVVQFGAPLRSMGFSLEESIALFGKWEKEGVNAELAIGSLRIAAGHFAREGIDLKEGLEETILAIQTASSESEGLALAMKVFGARAGPDMAAAIREGRFELEGAIEALQGTSGGLQDAADRSLTVAERFDLVKKQGLLALLPVGEAVLDLAEDAMPALQEILKAAQPILEDFAGEFKDTLGPALTIIIDSLNRIAQATGLTNEEFSGADLILKALEVTLDLIITAIQTASVGMYLLADAVEFVAGQVKGSLAAISAFGNSLAGLGDDLPDWLIPGSPTPLEIGIRGLSQALQDLPDFDQKFTVSGAMVGAGGAGGNMTIVNVDGVSATSVTGGGDPADEAIRLTLQLLRQALGRSA